MNDEGNEFWFHFGFRVCQLAIRETITAYLSDPEGEVLISLESDDERDDTGTITKYISNTINEGSFYCTINTFRGIRSTIKRFHVFQVYSQNADCHFQC